MMLLSYEIEMRFALISLILNFNSAFRQYYYVVQYKLIKRKA